MPRLEIGFVLPMGESFVDGTTTRFTHVEILVWPPTLAALEAMAPVLESIDAD